MSASGAAVAALASLTAFALVGGCGSAQSAGVTPATRTPAASVGAPPVSASGPAGAASTSPAPAAKPGAYVDYGTYAADPRSYAAGRVVLFFHAPWCPVCRRIEQQIQADGVPAGLTIVKVDYDSATDLKVKYGVTVQHTFVRVDAAGNALGRPVSDAEDLAQVVQAVA